MNHLYLFDEKGRASAYGVGTYIRNIVSLCVDYFIPVTVVSLNTEGDVKSFISDKGVLYLDIPMLKDERGEEIDIDQKSKREEYSLYVLAVLQSYITSSDFLIFHLNYTQDYFLANNLKKRWSTSKIILTVHYFTWCFSLQGNVHHLSLIVSKKKKDLTEFEKEVIYSGLFEQKLFQLVDCIVCLSVFAQEILESYYEIDASKIWLIKNGIKDFYKNENKDLLRKKYAIPADEKVLLFVGRLDRIKGIKYLIEAFKEVAEKMENVHLYIIGDGHFRDYLPLCAPLWKRITFCGKLLPEQVADFYEMGNIGILPSLHEQCSYVGIEMMMHCLPIIGTTSTGLDEMIESGINGYKIHIKELDNGIEFPVSDLSSLLLKLLQLASLDTYSRQSRNSYLYRYTDICMQDKLYKLYTFCFKGKEVPLQNADMLS